MLPFFETAKAECPYLRRPIGISQSTSHLKQRLLVSELQVWPAIWCGGGAIHVGGSSAFPLVSTTFEIARPRKGSVCCLMHPSPIRRRHVNRPETIACGIKDFNY